MEELNYYCYIHLRKTDLTPFYVGIGTTLKRYKSFESKHARAFSKKKRNSWWEKTYNKYGRVVEIVSYSDSREEICNIEKELIEKYKRKEDGGILVNLTDGGDNLFTHSEETVLKMKQRLYIPTFVYLKDGTFFKKFESSLETCKILNLRKGTLKEAIDHKKMYKDYFFSIEDLGQNIDLSIFKKTVKRQRPIVAIDDNGEKQFFQSTKEAAKLFETSPTNICRVLKTGQKFKNLKWEYADEKSRKYKKQICAYDREGNLIHSFESASKAGQFFNTDHGNIGKSARNGTPAYGLYWKYTSIPKKDTLQTDFEQPLHLDDQDLKIQNESEKIVPQ